MFTLKNTSLSILLILLSWTVLSAQSSSDTVKCYGVKKLQKIATALTKGQECDTLLKIANKQISNRDSVIHVQDVLIKYSDIQLRLKDNIITADSLNTVKLNKDIKIAHRKLKWTKTGWATSTLLIISGFFYLTLHK